MRQVVISNGHGKFHMLYAALGAERYGMLEQLITAAYPSPLLKGILRPMNEAIRSPRISRFLMRAIDGVPERKIRSCMMSEPLNQLAVRFPQYGCQGDRKPQLDALGFRMYQHTAARYIRRSEADVYHCRSGYGGKTISLARDRGMKVIIDHSIIHPQALMQSLVQRGSYDVFHPVELPPMWQLVQNDLEAADCILVNSDYVKTTLVDFGIPESNILVCYLGIDTDFEEYMRTHKRTPRDPSAPVKFLFAGGVGLRKGADTLLDAVRLLPKGGWSLTVAGGIEAPLSNLVKSFRHPSVKFLGAVLRTKLFQLMLEHDVFVFPTLAEGSARVVFEAMGAGMSVITTPNAGSVVKNEQHGYIITPGDKTGLHEKMLLAIQNPRKMRDFGTAAADFVYVHHHSSVYQDAIVTLYHKV